MAESAEIDEAGRSYVMAALAKLSGDQVEAVSRIAGMEDRLEDLAGALDAIELATESLSDGTEDSAPAEVAAGDGSAPAEDGLDMRALVGWVGDNVASLLERKLPQTGQPPHWCRKWWMHPEAIARFEAVRRSWAEAVAAGGNAMAVYFEHLDHHLAVLTGAGGPFSSCKGGEHQPNGVAALGQDLPSDAYFTEFEQLTDGDQRQ